MKILYKIYRVALFALIALIQFSDLKAQNTSLPVGSIQGNVDISLSSVGSYVIPIKVVPGTQGIQPEISIMYNSTGSLGSLGMRWDIAGISAITRTSQTQYHDQNITSLELTDNDRFMLDGNRLMVTSGTYGQNGTKYGTEIENFAKVTSYGRRGNGPEYFEVITEDGSKIEYGKGANARQELNGTVLTWYINKITDPYGNYMTYSYSHANNNPLIYEIAYTGNTGAGLPPYAKVRFNYQESQANNQNDIYIAGYSYRQHRILKNIEIYHNTSLVRKYQFIYDESKSIRLTEIKFSGENSAEFNSTKINWGSQTSTASFQTLSTENGSSIITGDFNGDGIQDYILYGMPYSENTEKWKMYYGNNNGVYSFACEGTHTHLPYIFIADCDGDGKDEFFIGERENDNSTVYIFRILTFTDNTYQQQTEAARISSFNHCISGDYNGDGKTDVLFIYNTGILKGGFFFTYGPMIGPMFFPNNTINVFDFNGNGKTNLQTREGGTTKIYEYNNSTRVLEEIFSDGFPTIWHKVYYGDFNGDGKQDILATSEGNWYMNLSTGKGYSYPHATAPPIQNYNYGFVTEPYIVDLDGDGKDDIVQFILRSTGQYTYQTDIHVYYSRGYSNNQYRYRKVVYTHQNMRSAYASNFQFADMNGDGKIDIIYKQQINSNPIICFTNKNEQYDLVKKITDGMGTETEWNYQYRSSPTLNYSDHYRKKVSWPVVSSINQSNGIGTQKTSITYGYGKVNYDADRRTVLGYEHVSITSNGITSRYTFTENPTYRHLTPHQVITYYGYDDYITDEINQYEYLNLGNKRFLPYKYSSTVTNIKTQSHETTNLRLRSDGRMDNTTIEYKDNPSSATAITREKKTFSYTTVNLPNSVSVLKPYTITTTTEMTGSSVTRTSTKRYSYSSGYLTTIRDSDAGHDDLITTLGNYNAFGLPLTKTVGGRTERYIYDNTGRFMTQHTNPVNQITNYSYDGKYGNITSVTDMNLLVTRYIYDSFGRQICTQYPDNTRDSVVFNWYTGTEIPNAKTYTTKYSTGLPVAKTYYDLLGRDLCQEQDNKCVDTRYNVKGEKTKTSLPYSIYDRRDDTKKKWNEYTYDVYGRLTREKSAYSDIRYTYSNSQITITDYIKNVTKVKNHDKAGRLVSVTDPGGSIEYSYTFKNIDSKQCLQTDITSNGSTITTITDARGNRLKMIDPDAGTITSTYNVNNEPLQTTDGNGNSVYYTYDLLGRVIEETHKEGTSQLRKVNYKYDSSGSGGKYKGKLSYVTIDNQIAEYHYYDNFGREIRKATYIDGIIFNHRYTYDNNGFINTIEYPDNFTIKHIYSNGRLYEIRRADNNSLIYKVYGRNVFGQTTKCAYGNNIARVYEYNEYGLPTQIRTGNKVDGSVIIQPKDPITQLSSNISLQAILPPPVEVYFDVNSAYQKWEYTYNTKGIMTGRTNVNTNQSENYVYDNLERLTSYTTNGGNNRTIAYSNSGNITSHTNVGSYKYPVAKPHAVTKISPSAISNLSFNQSCVTYNYLNKPEQITEGNYTLNLHYGYNNQRNKTTLRQNGAILNTTYFVSKLYERENKNSETRHINYIYGDDEIVAIFVKTNTDQTGKMYYVHTDHLGSYGLITDASKNVVQKCHFDPWGNRRNYDNWLNNYSEEPLLTRGFTGHEHLDQFRIINMNARLYDPVIGRFFSPDPYVQMPNFTQNYNRYSYCLNNPLSYTDPDGEWIHLLIGGICGGIMNWVTNGAEFSWKGLGYFGIGAAAGALGAGIGAGVNAAMATGGSFAGGFIGTTSTTTTGFIAGSVTGISSGFTSGFISGTGNSWMQGNSFKKGFVDGLYSGGISGLTSGVVGGISGGINAALNDRNFWTGSYKQYSMEPNLIASADNSCGYPYPDAATVANDDKYRVYYKPEEGPYGIKDYVEPGKYITKPVDGVATSKYTDKVFKIPDGGKVRVALGGDVKFRNGLGFYNALELINKAGWMSLNQLDNTWETLFKMAITIK